MVSRVLLGALGLVKEQGAMAEEKEYFSSGPLTDAERREIRRVLRDAAFSRRFWSVVRQWAAWISGSVLFALTFWDKIRLYLPRSTWPFGG